MQHKTLLGLGALGLSLAAGPVLATNGMISHGYSPLDKAVAGATTAYHFDALVTATNPAGLAFVDDSLVGGLSLFMPDRHYSSAGEASPLFAIGPQKIQSSGDLFVIPATAWAYRLDERQTLGLALYGNGGMNTRYKGGSATMFDAEGNSMTLPGTFGDGTAGVDLKQMFINATYAYRFKPEQALGLSLLLAGQSFKAYGISTFAGFSLDPDHLSDQGTDYAYGVGLKLGYQGKLTDALWLGAAYQPRIRMSNFDHYSGLFPDAGRFDIPGMANLGLAWQASDTWLWLLDVQHIFYSDVAAIANTSDAMYSCMQGVSRACLGIHQHRLRLAGHDGVQAGAAVSAGGLVAARWRQLRQEPDPRQRDPVQHPLPGSHRVALHPGRQLSGDGAPQPARQLYVCPGQEPQWQQQPLRPGRGQPEPDPHHRHVTTGAGSWF